MRMNVVLAAGMLTSVCTVTSSAENRKQPAPKSAELKALDRFAGDWDTKTNLILAGGKPKDVKLKGSATIEWTLGDRFLQWKGSSAPGGFKDLQLITFDAGKKAYRHWYFSSEGIADESTGTWDEDARTMTWNADLDGGKTMVNVVRFTDADTQEWKLVVKDKAGQAVTELHGKMTRRK